MVFFQYWGKELEGHETDLLHLLKPTYVEKDKEMCVSGKREQCDRSLSHIRGRTERIALVGAVFWPYVITNYVIAIRKYKRVKKKGENQV